MSLPFNESGPFDLIVSIGDKDKQVRIKRIKKGARSEISEKMQYCCRDKKRNWDSEIVRLIIILFNENFFPYGLPSLFSGTVNPVLN